MDFYYVVCDSKYVCTKLGRDTEVSSQSSVIGSGLWPSIFVDVLMDQLVRVLAIAGIGSWCQA